MIEYYADILGWRGGRRLYEGGGKGGSAAPPPPDYRGAALEQAAASKELAQQATFANRPTLNTPWGQMSWEAGAGVDPSTGLPITNWTGNLNLTAEQQNALDAQQRIQQGRSVAAETLLPQAVGNFQQGFNWGGVPAAGSAATLSPQMMAAQAGNVTAGQNAAYQRMAAMVEPQRQQERAALETRLANQGLSSGSEAYRRAQMAQAGQFAGQDERLLAQAMAEGRADVTQQYQMNQAQQAQQAAFDQQRFGQMGTAFGQQNLLRQQGLAEEQLRRGMSLNELNALLTQQQVQQPNMPQFNQAAMAQAPNLLGAAQSAGDYALANAKLQAQSGGSGLGSLLGTAGGLAAMYLTGGAAAPLVGAGVASGINSAFA